MGDRLTLEEVVACPLEEYPHLLADFVQAYSGLLHTHIRRLTLDPQTWPDLHQELVGTLVETVNRLRDGSLVKPESVRWETYLMGRVRNATRTYLDGASHKGVSGFHGQSRRHRYLINRERELTQSLGRTPTSGEVVAYANDHARTHRKNPVKQGMVFTSEDATLISPTTPINPLYDLAYRDEPPQLSAQNILEEAREYPPVVFYAAEALFAGLTHTLGGEQPPWEEVETQLGLSTPQSEAVKTQLAAIINAVG